MSLRETLNNNPRIVAGLLLIAATALILALSFTGRDRGLRDVVEVYYYDLEKEQLFIARTDEDPAAGRGEVVRARVYGCGGCGPDQRFVGYLIDEQARIRAVDGQRWVSPRSEAGDRIRQRPIQRCRAEGTRAVECEPN